MARKSSGDTIRVDGLAELSSALREFEPDLRKELRRVNKDIATAEAPKVRAAAAALGGIAAHAASSIKPSAGFDYAGIALGGAAHPEALGAEFGGQRRPTTMQFQPWRGSGSGAGYFLYPTIRRDMEQIVNEYAEGIDTVLRKAGWKP